VGYPFVSDIVFFLSFSEPQSFVLLDVPRLSLDQELRSGLLIEILVIVLSYLVFLYCLPWYFRLSKLFSFEASCRPFLFLLHFQCYRPVFSMSKTPLKGLKILLL